jgi:hypothetical protein
MADNVTFTDWRKSRRSFSNGNCAEIGTWRKSSRSANNGACAEVGRGDSVVGVRDSRLAGSSPVLVFGAEEWSVFLAAVKRDEGAHLAH